jgi:hypothetical protein
VSQSVFARHWWKLVLGLAIVAFLFWNPTTRAFVLWVLPLGSGIDDLIVIASLILIVVLAFVRGWVSLPQWLKRDR